MTDHTQTLPTTEQPVALVVELSLEQTDVTVDTSTIDGHRVVVIEQSDGDRILTATEALALTRAILSRLAYIGFPPDSLGEVRAA
ncbi:hypothetical protein [Microbacterium testaceum]|uniref:Uncharacterized protein n=1 Tax=Microbacterium testaceum TaxID=2033 RepID=A0A147F4Q6_MICTE|nr:hypothetical protein [Microbacterium testaceum]KTS09063.1 hypothetical protein RSA3_14295 [Microbacterium testaceum]